MRFHYLLFVLLFPLFGFGQPETQILPLNAGIRHALDESFFKENIVEYNPARLEMKKKVTTAESLSNEAFDLSSYNGGDFVFDVMFLTPKGLTKKYPKLNREKLLALQKKVDEVTR